MNEARWDDIENSCSIFGSTTVSRTRENDCQKDLGFKEKRGHLMHDLESSFVFSKVR